MEWEGTNSKVFEVITNLFANLKLYFALQKFILFLAAAAAETQVLISLLAFSVTILINDMRSY